MDKTSTYLFYILPDPERDIVEFITSPTTDSFGGGVDDGGVERKDYLYIIRYKWIL